MRALASTFRALACCSLIACQSPSPSKSASPREIHTPTYDLLLPDDQKALLILFPCFPCDAADTRAESRIADTAAANGIAVLMLNFNRHILMSEAEQQEVIGTIAGAVRRTAWMRRTRSSAASPPAAT